jgi:RHS repeat-associated protein
MPGRAFTSESYRYGFNGQEKNNDISGVDGGHLDFKYRVHDARLGRFLSVDPLSSSYPWNSTYAFAENRVIDGIDLEGLEYLNKDKARIEVTNGKVRLKIVNFHNVTQNLWNQANNNTSNWKPGEIGLSTVVGEFNWSINIPPVNPDLYQVGSPVDVNGMPSALPIIQTWSGNGKVSESTGELDQRYSVNKAASVGMAKTQTGARAMLIVDLLNFAIPIISQKLIDDDKHKIDEHIAIMANVVNDINIAMQIPCFIPDEYRNQKDLANIANVVLQGVNNTEDKGIYEIGIKIYRRISAVNQ